MKKNAFSLVELLAVIVIIGLILGITVPTVLGVMDKSKDNGYRDTVRSIFNSVKLYMTENRTVTSGTVALLDLNDKHIKSGNWEYIEATDNIILTNIEFKDGRFLCRLEYAERLDNFAITKTPCN